MDWNDREEVLEAVKQNGWSLQYASEDLKRDREIVLTAVKQYGRSLQYAGEELRGDREIVLAAVKRNGYSLQLVNEELRRDPSFMHECYQIAPDITSEYVLGDLKEFPELYIDFHDTKPAKI